jgi:hypothetical protein
MIVLKIAIISICVLCITCMSIYVYQAVKGGSRTIYMQEAPSEYLTFAQKIFLGMAALGLLICFYQGAEAMLSWLPNSWGRTNAEGEFITLKNSASAIFTLFAGFGLIAYLNKAGPASIAFQHAKEKIQLYEQIFNAIISSDSLSHDRSMLLKSIKNDIENRIDELGVDAHDGNWQRAPTARNHYPDSQRYRNLRQLIRTIDELETRFGNS